MVLSAQSIERADQVGPQAGGRKRMGHAWSRARVQLAVENLRHQMTGHREKILVRGAAPSWDKTAHGVSVALNPGEQAHTNLVGNPAYGAVHDVLSGRGTRGGIAEGHLL